jgi:hypothetical protein
MTSKAVITASFRVLTDLLLTRHCTIQCCIVSGLSYWCPKYLINYSVGRAPLSRS